jgi:hypothetical protein
MASDIDEIMFEVDAGYATAAERRFYDGPRRVTTEAHPFSERELAAFLASGEHTGLE